MKTPDGKEINDKLLCQKFPHLFKDRTAPMTQTSFCWGFECGEGWYGLIYKAAEKLEPLIVAWIDARIFDKDYDSLDYVPTTSQIKEKYGTLRWYMTSNTDEMQDIIDMAERESETVCEQCGAPGTLRDEGWMFTACNACAQKRK